MSSPPRRSEPFPIPLSPSLVDISRVILHVFFSTFTSTYIYICSSFFVYSIVVVAAVAAAVAPFVVVVVGFSCSYTPRLSSIPFTHRRSSFAVICPSSVTTATRYHHHRFSRYHGYCYPRARKAEPVWLDPLALLQVDDTEQVSADLG